MTTITLPRSVVRQALDAQKIARHSHGVVLLSDPPQDAWRARGVDAALDAASKALSAALEQPQADTALCPNSGSLSQLRPRM